MKWTFWTRPEPLNPDDCETIDPLLSLYADGMASAEETRRVEAHLPGCAACRASLAWMQATQRALAARPVVSPPADLRARIAAAIAASSATPAPASFTTRRPVALRPAFAAAASVAVLGVVSYGLLRSHPQVAVRAVKSPPQMASGSPMSAPPLVTKPVTVPGLKPRLPHHAVVAPMPMRSHAELTAHVPSDEAPPEPTAAKTPASVVPATKAPAPSAPLMAAFKPRVLAVKKPMLPKFKPEMLATNNLPAPPVEAHKAEAHKAPAVKPEDLKPEIVAVTAPPTPPVVVNVGPPSIKQDPAPTMVAAGTHEGRLQPADLLSSVNAHVKQMRAFTHDTIILADKRASAMSTLAENRTPTFDFVHGPTH